MRLLSDGRVHLIIAVICDNSYVDYYRSSVFVVIASPVTSFVCIFFPHDRVVALNNGKHAVDNRAVSSCRCQHRRNDSKWWGFIITIFLGIYVE